MGFLNSWALFVGLIALGLPWLVHLLTKPRPKSLPLSTIDFVYQALSQRKSRHRLRDWLVLLLRCLAIALIAAAIARPLWRQSVIAIDSSDSTIARVVLVDISQSMSAGRGGNQPVSRAAPIARKYLTAKGAQDLNAALVMVSANPKSVYENLSTNLTVLRRHAGDLQAVPQAANVNAALLVAADLLKKSPDQARKEVVIVSDFQRSDWGSMQLDVLPNDVHIQLESVALDQSTNIALGKVTTPDQIVAGQAVDLSIQVRNDSPTRRAVDCRLEMNGETQTKRLELPLGLSMVKMQVRVDDDQPQSGVVELLDPQSGLLGDDLPEDDMATFTFAAATPPQALLISGQNPQRIPSSSYYLQRAGQQLFTDQGFRRLNSSSIDRDSLQSVDLIILDHPGRIPSAAIQTLVQRVQRGAGLLYCAAEPADAVNLNAIEKQAGSSLQLPVEYLPPRGGRLRRDLAIDSVSRREAPFAVFGDSIDAAMQELRFGGGLRTQPTEESLEDLVLATLEDQSAWLVNVDCGGGKIAVMNSDLQKSNLPVRPAFIPLIGEMTKMLLPRGTGNTQSPCGIPMVRTLPASIGPEDELSIEPIDDWPTIDEGYGAIEVSGPGMTWTWNLPPKRGLYGVFHEGKCISQVATNIPESESDLVVLNPEQYEPGQTGVDGQDNKKIAFRDATENTEDKDRLWNLLLTVCVLGLAAELFTLSGFRH